MAHIKENKEEKAIKLAEQLGSGANPEDIQDAQVKLPAMRRGPIAKIWHKVQDLYRAFMSEETPASVRTLIIGGLLYLVLPLDIVPDFLPIVGLLDDVTVIGFIWKKLSGLAKIGMKVVNKTLPDHIEKEITQAYNQAFAVAQDTLKKALHRQFRITLLNCLINIGFLLIAVLFLSIEGELSLLLASLCVLVMLLRALYAFGKVLPTIHCLCRAWREKRTIDGAVAQFLRTRYVFIEPVEKMKARIKVLDGIPSLETMVGMQRKALKKSMILVGVSIVVATALVFTLRFLLIRLGTSYTLFDLLSYPFTRLWGYVLS
jgi:uncharacterized membrane protein YkvA (DUF1232 family)